MKRCNDIASWRDYRRQPGLGSIGFVPTMGALHAGHRSLIERSVEENDSTVVSIFVNPTQFDEAADLDAYPSTLDADLAMLEACGVDAVFLPNRDVLYPDNYRYRVSENDLSRRLCGAYRAGHFDGVLTVVMRLLNIVKPHKAYFGEKDYQQLLLVRDMVDAFFMDVEIVACPTVRERDGLAMSSRNLRLGEEERRLAPRLAQLLRDSASAEEAAMALTGCGFEVDYVEDFLGRRLAAARMGDIRLIDNVALETVDG